MVVTNQRGLLGAQHQRNFRWAIRSEGSGVPSLDSRGHSEVSPVTLVSSCCARCGMPGAQVTRCDRVGSDRVQASPRCWRLGGSRRPTRTLVNSTKKSGHWVAQMFRREKNSRLYKRSHRRESNETDAWAITVRRATGRVQSDHVL